MVNQGPPRWLGNRAHALDRRSLIDVSDEARRCGLTLPLAIGSHAWDQLIAGDTEAESLSRLVRYALTVHRANQRHNRPHTVFVYGGRLLYLYSHVDPDAGPVLTLVVADDR